MLLLRLSARLATTVLLSRSPAIDVPLDHTPPLLARPTALLVLLVIIVMPLARHNVLLVVSLLDRPITARAALKVPIRLRALRAALHVLLAMPVWMELRLLRASWASTAVVAHLPLAKPALKED